MKNIGGGLYRCPGCKRDLPANRFPYKTQYCRSCLAIRDASKTIDQGATETRRRIEDLQERKAALRDLEQ